MKQADAILLQVNLYFFTTLVSRVNMAANINEELEWFTVFRTDKNDGWLGQELKKGRLRQGWGARGCALLTAGGQRVDRAEFLEGYREANWGEASPMRFAILTRMLGLKHNDVVVIPKMPEPNQFTIARVRHPGYQFDYESDLDDYRHIVHIEPESVRTFDYRANEYAYLISGLFARANHRPAISFCYSAEQIEAASLLLEQPNNANANPNLPEEFYRAAIDDAFRTAAIMLDNQIQNWNGPRFEEAVRQAFKDQGYEMKSPRRYDGQGGDVDILVSPPTSPYGVFLPGEIAVQVKWIQGVDNDDANAVAQIIQWAESQGSNAAKYVISSASGFTKGAQNHAADGDVILIGGLQTMCFLLGVADRYRDDWAPIE